MQIICIWSSQLHCHSLSLALVKSRLVLVSAHRVGLILNKVQKAIKRVHVCVCVCVCAIHVLRIQLISNVASDKHITAMLSMLNACFSYNT